MNEVEAVATLRKARAQRLAIALSDILMCSTRGDYQETMATLEMLNFTVLLTFQRLKLASVRDSVTAMHDGIIDRLAKENQGT